MEINGRMVQFGKEMRNQNVWRDGINFDPQLTNLNGITVTIIKVHHCLLATPMYVPFFYERQIKSLGQKE